MNLQETQHALLCSRMLPLSESDIRSRIIILGIQSRQSVYQINGHLEDQKLPLIRISADMPTARISDTYSWDPETNSITIRQASGDAPAGSGNSSLEDYSCGNIQVSFSDKKPEDYFADQYTGTQVLTNERDGSHLYLEVILDFDKENTDAESYVRTEEQQKHHLNEEEQGSTDENSTCFLAHYNSTLEATKSPFFIAFLNIEHEISKKIDEHIAYTDDTANYGYRADLCWPYDKSNIRLVLEFYNDNDPKSREYFQMIRGMDGKCLFTGSHESCFKKLSLGPDNYKMFYGKEPRMDYFLQVTSETVQNLEPYYQFIYKKVLSLLNNYIVDKYHGFGLDFQTILREQLDCINHAIILQYNMDEYDVNWTNLLEVERLIVLLEDPKQKEIETVMTHFHMLYTARQLKKKREIKKREKLLRESGRNALTHADIFTPEEQKRIFSAYGQFLYDEYTETKDQKKSEDLLPLLEELLDLIENHYAFSENTSDDNYCRLQIYHHKAEIAWDISKDVSLAEEYFRKCIKEILKCQIDKDPHHSVNTAIIYNNYAKLLLDFISAHEALIYYGRALEILEAFRWSGNDFSDFEEGLTDHIVKAMIEIYEKQNCPQEKERLLKRCELLKHNC